MLIGPTAQQQGQLPIETTGFVGREAELARLTALLDRARLITVTGPGGVGKTRIALRAAALAAPGYADGAFLVELSSVREPDLVVPAVASALGLGETPGGVNLAAVLAHLGDRHLLLILDTCEHLIDACAAFAEAVVARTARVTLLTTSREPLDVSGENACPVAPLPVPELSELDGDRRGRLGGVCPAGPLGPRDGGGDAVDLFLQRAAAAVPGFTLSPGDLPDVIALCRRLDGIPLAIELAAARLRALPLGELVNRLDQRLPLLTNGHHGGRHRTLRATIGWSHDACTPAERALWARISVFAGPFTMSAAEEVCGDLADDDQVMPTVIRLVDKSVLTRIEQGAGEPTRYLMLDTFREFGAERLGLAAADLGRRRLIGRYLAMARNFREHFLDDDQLTLLRELRREYPNTRGALECALGDEANQPSGAGRSRRAADGVELAIALAVYWRTCGLTSEGCYWLNRAASAAPEGSAAQGRALLEHGRLLSMRGDTDNALAAAERGLDIAAGHGHDALAAEAYLVRAAALAAEGRLTAATESCEEARSRLTAAGDRLGLADLDELSTQLALLGGDVEAALGHVERGLRQLGDSQERWSHARLYLLAALALYLARRDIESTWTVTRALRVKREIGDVTGVAFALEVLGWLAARSGDHQRAALLLGGAEPLWRRASRRLATAPALEPVHAAVATGCADVLGAQRFADLLDEGARRAPEAIISFALNGRGDSAEPNGAKVPRPSQLTAREREIASMVAVGLSNRQIAEQLVISRRTVDTHLEHIFTKLGISSRVMLTIQLRDHSTESQIDANA